MQNAEAQSHGLTRTLEFRLFLLLRDYLNWQAFGLAFVFRS